MKTSIPTQAEYEAREARLHLFAINEIERATLHDRKFGQSAWLAAMTEYPDMIRERAEWLLEGCYGYGACRAAIAIQSGTLRNKAAALGQLIAALEWHCPARMATDAWKSLSAIQQSKVNAALTSALKTKGAI